MSLITKTVTKSKTVFNFSENLSFGKTSHFPFDFFLYDKLHTFDYLITGKVAGTNIASARPVHLQLSYQLFGADLHL